MPLGPGDALKEEVPPTGACDFLDTDDPVAAMEFIRVVEDEGVQLWLLARVVEPDAGRRAGGARVAFLHRDRAYGAMPMRWQLSQT